MSGTQAGGHSCHEVDEECSCTVREFGCLCVRSKCTRMCLARRSCPRKTSSPPRAPWHGQIDGYSYVEPNLSVNLEPTVAVPGVATLLRCPRRQQLQVHLPPRVMLRHSLRQNLPPRRGQPARPKYPSANLHAHHKRCADSDCCWAYRAMSASLGAWLKRSVEHCCGR